MEKSRQNTEPASLGRATMEGVAVAGIPLVTIAAMRGLWRYAMNKAADTVALATEEINGDRSDGPLHWLAGKGADVLEYINDRLSEEPAQRQ